MIFPGQSRRQRRRADGRRDHPGILTASPGVDGDLLRFIASRPGTYMYHSGSDMALQVEMGLLGALIVRPAMGAELCLQQRRHPMGPGVPVPPDRDGPADPRRRRVRNLDQASRY